MSGNSKTVSVSTAQVVTLDASYDYIEVVNLGTAYVGFRADGVAAVLDADNTIAVPAGTSRIIETPSGAVSVVSVVSSTGTQKVCVLGSKVHAGAPPVGAWGE